MTTFGPKSERAFITLLSSFSSYGPSLNGSCKRQYASVMFGVKMSAFSQSLVMLCAVSLLKMPYSVPLSPITGSTRRSGRLCSSVNSSKISRTVSICSRLLRYPEQMPSNAAPSRFQCCAVFSISSVKSRYTGSLKPPCVESTAVGSTDVSHPKADSTGSITVSEHFPAPERSLMTAARRGFSSVFKNCIGFFPHFKSISAFIVTAAENKVN